ncbi:unnamed protein product [Arabidopsis halleri]
MTSMSCSQHFGLRLRTLIRSYFQVVFPLNFNNHLIFYSPTTRNTIITNIATISSNYQSFRPIESNVIPYL